MTVILYKTRALKLRTINKLTNIKPVRINILIKNTSLFGHLSVTAEKKFYARWHLVLLGDGVEGEEEALHLGELKLGVTALRRVQAFRRRRQVVLK